MVELLNPGAKRILEDLKYVGLITMQSFVVSQRDDFCCVALLAGVPADEIICLRVKFFWPGYRLVWPKHRL